MRSRFDELHLVLIADPFYGAGELQTVTTTERNAQGQDVEVSITQASYRAQGHDRGAKPLAADQSAQRLCRDALEAEILGANASLRPEPAKANECFYWLACWPISSDVGCK